MTSLQITGTAYQPTHPFAMDILAMAQQSGRAQAVRFALENLGRSVADHPMSDSLQVIEARQSLLQGLCAVDAVLDNPFGTVPLLMRGVSHHNMTAIANSYVLASLSYERNQDLRAHLMEPEASASVARFASHCMAADARSRATGKAGDGIGKEAGTLPSFEVHIGDLLLRGGPLVSNEGKFLILWSALTYMEVDRLVSSPHRHHRLVQGLMNLCESLVTMPPDTKQALKQSFESRLKRRSADPKVERMVKLVFHDDKFAKYREAFDPKIGKNRSLASAIHKFIFGAVVR